MIARTDHIPQDLIQAFVDGGLEREEEQAVRAHLSSCGECREACETFRAFDDALRGLPVEKTNAAFTATVMHLLGLSPAGRRVPSLAENMGYLAGLLIVLGVMVSAFVWTGVIGGVEAEQGLFRGYLSGAGDFVGSGVEAFAGWLTTFFPFAFGKGALGISFFVFLIVALLAVVDHLAERRLLRKT